MENKKRRSSKPILGLKQTKTTTPWYKGRLCPIVKQTAWFLKPLTELPDGYDKTKDVFMYPNYISQYILPVKERDLLEFKLGDRDKTKPMACKLRVSQYFPRSRKELIEYMAKLTEDLESVCHKNVLAQVLPCSGMWRFLGSPVFTNTEDEEFTTTEYIESLLTLLKLLLHHRKHYKALLEEVMKTVTHGKIFQTSNTESLPTFIQSCSYGKEDQFYSEELNAFLSSELVRSFCHDVIRQVPLVTRCLLPTVTAVSKKITNASTQDFLCTLLALNAAGENGFTANTSVWMELPLIPTNQELLGNLVEKDRSLMPVRTQTPYDDPEHYMDTYFRLLRAETFSAMQRGIKDLKASTLDIRDMNVYYNIHLAGFELQSGRFSIAVSFIPTKKVVKWEASPHLMFGNLVCLSINRKFDDVIWATVANRDSELLNKHQIIFLDLLDENVMSISEVINSLQMQEGSALMVESPTYYQSLSPVLRSMKEFDMETFPLQEEVIYAKSSGEIPAYLTNATIQTSIVCKSNRGTEKSKEGENKENQEGTPEDDDPELQDDYLESEQTVDKTGANIDMEFSATTSCERSDEIGGRMMVDRFLELFNCNSTSSLEASQCKALTHALKNRLAIIQGPPGCGKTFIGVKIVQLLLSLSPELEKPILLLTYKNHALDEFLKHMLAFCPVEDIVRIGGRSRESALDECNFRNIQTTILYEKAIRAEIQNTRTEIDDTEYQIKNTSKAINVSSFLTQRSLVDELSEEQIQSLIVEAGWENGSSMVYRIGRGKRANKIWMKHMLENVSLSYGSVKEFLQNAFEFGVSKHDSLAITCIDVFQRVFKAWLPDFQELKRMKEFQAQFTLQIQIEGTTDDNQSKEQEEGDDDADDSGDEDYVKQLLETRMAASAKQRVRSDDLIILDSNKSKDRQDILVNISDYPVDMTVSSQIRSVSNLWSLKEVQKLQFLYCILYEKTTGLSQELNDLIEKLQRLKNRREELEMTDTVKMLLQKKIIGVTITGASINHDLLHHIGPSIVIVEEAAEILEPSLLAALSSSIEHLILIGDHKQLRPQVDTYELCKKFHFDVSMMERLIESGFPFKSLTKQNRMRPEFSALLHDIYPYLENNLPLVSKNEPLKCFEKSMFFWCHDDPEKKDRTYKNVGEAERIVALVIYLLCNGVRPSEITVLAAYLGQTKLLKIMLKREKQKSPQLFQENEEERERFVQVQTIDMYQGDENEYVIISLVRSNVENNIGFLNRINRRCVAQSRAKCGMYFVGNANTLLGAKESCWRTLITSMMQQDCVAYVFPLQCIKHQISKYKAVDDQNVRAVIASPTLLCKQLCGDPYPRCDKHTCRKPCFPRHFHEDCPETVDDYFPGCGHNIKRKCPQKLSDLKCKVEQIVDLPCGHAGMKKCFEQIKDVQCKIKVTETFPRCGHKTEKACHVKIDTLKCQHPCRQMNNCGIHWCKTVCGMIHGHDTCSAMVDYKFPICGHQSTTKKKCSEPVTKKCYKEVTFSGVCGHEIKKKCHQNESEVKCRFPCERKRKCDHPCANECGDDCEKGECKPCLKIYNKKMEKFREVARQRAKELEEKIQKEDVPNFSRDEIRGTGPTAAEYQKVTDQVLKFIQPCHNWFPNINKIEKVSNLVLEKKFEAAKSRAFGDYIDTKFHGTSNEGVYSIIRKGFKLPEANPRPPKQLGMYGQGIYFATDSSKSARSIYTKGSQKLLLCQVILGKSMTVEKSDNTLNRKKLRAKNFDSVYAPRGTEVVNDEFVIFDPDQALPKYIIHFSDSNKFVPPSPTTLTNRRFFLKNMIASRKVNFQDPFEMYYNFAESHFRRMAAKTNLQPATISSIDIVINKDLEDKFEATRTSFKSQGIPDDEILAYHGTNKANIQSILKTNLHLSFARRQAYGKGNYFSEYPSISLGYGDGLLLCRILPGKEFVDNSHSNIPPNYNSKKVLQQIQPGNASAANASGEMIIIENSDQILPFFVIHR